MEGLSRRPGQLALFRSEKDQYRQCKQAGSSLDIPDRGRYKLYLQSAGGRQRRIFRGEAGLARSRGRSHRKGAVGLHVPVRERGSRVDRHAKIGAGKLGLAPFRHLLNDPRFAKVPMYLETPKGQEQGELLDAINLRTLRKLIRK